MTASSATMGSRPGLYDGLLGDDLGSATATAGLDDDVRGSAATPACRTTGRAGAGGV